MLNFFRRLSRKGRSEDSFQTETQEPDAQQKTPTEIVVEGMPPLAISEHLVWENGLPYPNWNAIGSWVNTATDDSMAIAAHTACERAWLLHFAEALGSDFRLSESRNVMLLSSAKPGIVQAKLSFIERMLKRISGVLDGLADISSCGKEILIVFDNSEDYYRYAFHYFPEKGEFAHSGGMFISSEGCDHFITMASNDLSLIEPTIVHEMTHACLSHLSLPRWIDEGLAVNVERRLTRQTNALYSPQEMHKKHLKFWGVSEIQEFWSGELFYRADDNANRLSYDLARILVEQLARDWDRFQQFALAADWRDGGARAAREVFGISLGAWVASMFEKEDAEAFEPLEREEEEETNA